MMQLDRNIDVCWRWNREDERLVSKPTFTFSTSSSIQFWTAVD